MFRTTPKRGNAARVLNSARVNHVHPPPPNMNSAKAKVNIDANAQAGPSRQPHAAQSNSNSPKMPGALEIPSFVYPTSKPADDQFTPKEPRRVSGPERTRERAQRRMNPVCSRLWRPPVNQDPDLGSDVLDLLKLAEYRTAGRQLTREEQQFLSDLRNLAENTYEARKVTRYEEKIARATLEMPERERKREEKRRLHREKLAREEREAAERQRREEQWTRYKAEAERLRLERVRRLAEQEEQRKRAREERRQREEAEAAAFEAQREKQRREEEARHQREDYERLKKMQQQRQQEQLRQQQQQRDASGKVWDVFSLYDAKWREIKKPQAPLVNIDAVQLPWPVLTPGEVTETRVREFMLHPQRYAHCKDKIRTELLNWHPDKFEARVLPIVRDEERVIVKQLAVEVARWIMDLSAESL
jgi:hypothetical protein